MTTDAHRASHHITRLLEKQSREALRQQLKPKPEPPPLKIPDGRRINEETLNRRWQIPLPTLSPKNRAILLGD